MEKNRAIAAVSRVVREGWLAEIGAGRVLPKPQLFLFDVDLVSHYSGANTQAEYPIRTARGAVRPPAAPQNERESLPQWAFFADDMPEANWEHPCRYLFVYSRAEPFSLFVVSETLPPEADTNAPLIEIVDLLPSL